MDLQPDELESFLSSPVNPARNLLCLANAALAADGQGVCESTTCEGDGIIASCSDSRQPWSVLQSAQSQQAAERSGVTEEPSGGADRFGAQRQPAEEHSGLREELSGAAYRRGDASGLGEGHGNGRACQPTKSSLSVVASRDGEPTRRGGSDYFPELRRHRKPRRIQTDSSSDEDVVSARGREKPERRSFEYNDVRSREKTKVRFRPTERGRKDVCGRVVSGGRRRSHFSSASEDEEPVNRRRMEDYSPVETRRRSTSSSVERSERGKNYRYSGHSVGTKLGTYNGSTCLETFLAKFDNCAEYFRWNSEARLFHLRGSLDGPAGEVLWAAGKHTSVKQLVQLLRNRFGNESQAERFRSELRARRRRPGESLQNLYIDICRLMTLAYPGPPSDLSQIVARDAFLEALNEKSLRIRILEREPTTLDTALNIACRLEAFDKGNCTEQSERVDAGNKHREKYVKVATAAGGNTDPSDQSSQRISAQLSELLSGLEFCKGELLQQRKEIDQFRLQEQQARNVNGNTTMATGRGYASFSDLSGDRQPNGAGWYSGLATPSVSYADVVDSVGGGQVLQKAGSKHEYKPKQRIDKDTCRKCGQKGHWARECPRSQVEKENEGQPEVHSKLMAASNHGSGRSADVYLPVVILGKRMLALLDTGCETSVIGRRLVPEADLEPTSNRLFAANGTAIPLIGQLSVEMKVGGHQISTTVVVSEALHELILGIDFLTSHECRWEFGRGVIEVNGRKVQLQSRRSSHRVCRIYTEEETVVPAGQQGHVPVQVTLPDLQDVSTDLVVEPKTLGSGALLARTLLSGLHLKSVVPVWNLTDVDCSLQKGTFVGDAKAASVYEDVEVNELDMKEAEPVGSEVAAEPDFVIGNGRGMLHCPVQECSGAEGCFLRCSGSQLSGQERSGQHHINEECSGPEGSVSQCSGSRLSCQECSGVARAESRAAEEEQSQEIPPHVQCVLESLPSELTPAEKRTAEGFVSANADVFSASEFDLGRTGLVKHTIDTGGNLSFKQQLRRHPIAYLPVIDKHVEEMAANGIVEPTISPWASNVVLVRKQDGGLRFCVDYRQLNSLTVKDSYALPRTDMCLEALGGARYFSTLDCRQGYWQIELDEKSSQKTAFVTRRGLWKFKVLPFGLSNAPACFQRVIDLVLTGLQWEVCLAFLDDIIVFASTFEQQLERLSMVFDRLRKANLKLKPSKCRLFQLKVRFLGSIVSGDGIEPDPQKVKAVVDWPVPRNVTETRAFVALASYYRRHIRHFAEVARPLHLLTKKGRPFFWGPEQMTAFGKLKQCLVSAPVLAPPVGDGKYIVDSDASDEALGAVLQQEQNGVVKVIAYASRVLQPAERRYCTTRKELLAIVYGLKQFRHYLLAGNHPFVLRTDHAALTSLLRTPEPVGQQARYLDLLSEFNFTIVHRPGSQHQNSDALSRRPCEREQIEPPCRQCKVKVTSKCRRMNSITDCPEASVTTLTKNVVRSEQRNDDVTSVVIYRMESSDEQPSWAEVQGHSPDVQDLWSQWQSLEIVDEILYRQYQRPDGSIKHRQIIVPRSLRLSVLTEVHGGIASGHFGSLKTQQKLQRYAYWKGWKTDVELFVRRCNTCSSFRRGPKRRQGPLQYAPAVTVMQKVHVDLTGPHVRSKNGFTYLLTAICSFSKYLIAVPLRDKSALSVAKALVKHVFLVYGASELLIHDGGKEFCNEVMEHVSRLFGVQRSVVSPYRPSANGSVERVHATINSVFAKSISSNQRDWCELTPCVVFCYNTCYHVSTTFSPFYLMFLREPIVGLDLMLETPSYEIPSNVDEYVEVTRTRMLKAYETVRGQLRGAFSRAKRRYDQRVKFLQFQPGEYVWYYNPRRYKGIGRKWQLCTAPYRIIRRLNLVNYVIQRTPRTQPFVTHVDRLKRHEGVPVCWQKADVEESISGGQVPESSGRNVPTAAESVTLRRDQSKRPKRNVPPPAEDSAAADDATGRPQRDRKLPLRYQNAEWCCRVNMSFTCSICEAFYETESGLQRHLLLQHGRRHRRNRSPEVIPPDELSVQIEKHRFHQANSRKRKELRLAGKAPSSVTGATITAGTPTTSEPTPGIAVCRQMTQQPPPSDELPASDAAVLEMNWPRRWLSDSETDEEPRRRRRRPVRHEASTQITTEVKDQETETEAVPSSEAAVQVRPRSLIGPELPPAGFCYNDVVQAARDYPDLSPAEIVQEMTRDIGISRQERLRLLGFTTVAVAAERSLGQFLYRRLQDAQAAGPDRPELLRRALAELEGVAQRFVSSDDLRAVGDTTDFDED